MALPLKTEWFDKYSRDAGYIIRCDTCGKVFLETTLEKYANMVGYTWDELNNPSLLTKLTLLTKFKMFKEYIKAGRHWVKYMDHEIKVFAREDKEGILTQEVLFTLSDKWVEGLAKERAKSKELMTEELNLLVTKIGSRIG